MIDPRNKTLRQFMQEYLQGMGAAEIGAVIDEALNALDVVAIEGDEAYAEATNSIDPENWTVIHEMEATR